MKASAYVGTSLDGFIARKDGNIDWLIKFDSAEITKAYKEFEGRVDAIVMGRGTFDSVGSFPSWPYEKPVFVLSASLSQVPDSLREKATILSMKPREVISHMAGRGFSRLYVDGGRVIQSFLKDDLIDELIIAQVPVLIGSGIPLFGYLSAEVRFKHMQTVVFKNGLVQSYYERDR